MEILGKIIRTLRCQFRRIEYELAKKINDDWFDHVRFRQSVGYRLNYKNPCTFNEKLMWLNKYWIPQLKVDCTDKYAIHTYVQSNLQPYWSNPTRYHTMQSILRNYHPE